LRTAPATIARSRARRRLDRYRVPTGSFLTSTSGSFLTSVAAKEQLALIQTVKAETDNVQNTTAGSSDPDQQALVVGQGEVGAGRMVDVIAHPNSPDDATQNPIYGVMTDTSTDLTEGTPNVGTSRRGDHVRNPDGTFQPPTSAKIDDSPRRIVDASGRTHEMTFEVAALITDGPMANTYVGAVEWGWTSVDTTVTPKPLRAVASGAPTAGFMGAAAVWNDATMNNANGTTEATIDLPITSLPSSVRAAVELGTVQLLERLKIVNTGLEGLAGAELKNREFEKRALEAEANRRSFTINVRCDRLQDTGSAASPPEDEVWLSLSNGGTMLTTSAQTITAGSQFDHKMIVGDFLPFDGPVTVRVMEHDRAGTRSRPRDHAIAEFEWAPPFDPHVELSSSNGDYSIAVRFDR